MEFSFKNVQIDYIKSCIGKNSVDVKTFLSDYMPLDKVNKIIKILGFTNIRYTDLENTVFNLTCAALDELFEINQDLIKEIDAIVFVTQTPDTLVPANSYRLQRKYNFNQNILMLDLIQGCSGFPYGLFYASNLIESRVCNKVLVCVGDTSSAVHNIQYAKQPVNAAIFGDGVTCAILSYCKTINHSHYSISSFGNKCDVIENFNTSYKKIRESYINNSQFVSLPRTGCLINGAELASFTIDNVPYSVNNLLNRTNMSFDDISYVIFHQGNKSLVESLGKSLSIEKGKYPFLSDTVGNLSSASVSIALNYGVNNSLLPNIKNKPIILSAFGVGLSSATSILDLKETVFLEISEV